MSDERYNRMKEMYEAGPVPWDDPEPPPEVLDLIPALTPGRALDLGCGLGRASLYMARQGWAVDGVDFIPQAIAEASARAGAAGLADLAHFHVGSITAMPFLDGPYDFALDVGCLHGLQPAEAAACRDELLRLLRPGAVYLLFAHLNASEPGQQEGRWLDEGDLMALFTDGFTLDRAEYGTTQVRDWEPWRSAWFWFRRV